MTDRAKRPRPEGRRAWSGGGVIMTALLLSIACGGGDETKPKFDGEGGAAGTGGRMAGGASPRDAGDGDSSRSDGGSSGTSGAGGRPGGAGGTFDASVRRDAALDATADGSDAATDTGPTFAPPIDACEPTERCDGIDNDCDGLIDEDDPGAGGGCDTGLVGACAAGVLSCVGGSLVCTATVTATPEVCNGLDDDCDGAVDQDNPEGGGACTTGLSGVCDAGTLTCQGGVLSCVQNVAESAELCNGLDDDCDGTPDQGDPEGGAPCNTGLQGSCATGVTQCQSGSIACVPANVSAEVCNGLDDDCDGTPDQGDPGGGTPCDTGLPGACAAGTNACVNGSVRCVALSVATETCNGIDDDCDGTIDDGNPGGGALCDTGQPGACAPGTQTCQGGSLDCVAQVAPSAETCNGIDDDCDGTVDNGNPDGGAACNTGLPGVCATGSMTCREGALVCLANSAAAETCNGVDDDCDGTVDEENPEGGAPCSTGLSGACDAGTVTCEGGTLSCVQAVFQTPEVCNDVDDDCDGVVDNGNPEGGAACSTGLPGICNAGTVTCQAGALSCVQNQAATAELCNGLDDDCNGTADDGNPEGGAVCSTGLPGTCDPGTITCTGGSLQCVPDAPPSAELCNDIDDDCNGVVDDGNPEGGAPCNTGLLGVCASGTMTCQAGGSLGCVQDVSADVEACNGLDDDCNGTVDDGGNGCGGACALGHPPGDPCDFIGPLDLDACEDDSYVCSGMNDTVCVDIDTDVDGDGYSPGSPLCGGDCDDTSVSIVPGATEVCDVVDNDCNGFVDEVCTCETYSWDGGGDGSTWSDALNWAPDAVPGSGPNHCVSIPAGAMVTLADPLAFGLHSLTLDGTLTHPAADVDGITLSAVDLVIGTTGRVDATGRGFGELAGPGAGANGSACSCGGSISGSGGGYGAVGGASQNGSPAGGPSYGELASPSGLGSGGGRRACGAGGTAGLGGGLVRLVVPGTLTIDGSIEADGTTSATNCSNGGGSGGSVWITAGTILTNGAPTISANGGDGTVDCGCGTSVGAGSGAGGRIAIDGFAGGLPPTLGIDAHAGSPAGNGRRGGAGTIYFHGSDEPAGHLLVDNASSTGAMTPIPAATELTLSDATVLGGARLEISEDDAVDVADAITVADAGSHLITHLPQAPTTIDVGAGSTLTTAAPLVATTAAVDGTLTHVAADIDGVTLTATDLSVGATGAVDASGRGFGELAGPGAGANGTACSCGSSISGSGGGHGALGGAGQTGAPAGGASYGELPSPSDLGSGGGRRACGAGGTAGLGGGRIRLTVTGELTLDGGIRADGTTSATNCSNGGGSGGSVWITAASIVTTTTPPLISANGGNGTVDCSCGASGGGSGAGGRIAIDGFAGTLPAGLVLEAKAGDPAGDGRRGGAGTVFWQSAGEAFGHLDVDNAGGAGSAVTPLPDATNVTVSDFGIGGGAVVWIDAEDGITTNDALTVRETGTLRTTVPLSTTTLTVDGTLSHAPGDPDGVTLRAIDMSIGATGTIQATGRGHGQLAGPGAGANGTACSCGSSISGSGAGHGGRGGGGQGGVPAGGALYGSRQGTPIDLGSGGGRRACGASGTAGLGGGLVHLLVDGTLSVDGAILASGTTSATNCSNGGGSGGSIWITATSVRTTGTPVIAADGGHGTLDCGCGATVGAGGGGGGRIAIFADENSLGGSLATATPGTGAGSGLSGNPGIVYQFPGSDSLVSPTSPPDGGAGSATSTLLEWTGFSLGGTQHFHVELDDDPHFAEGGSHPETGAAPVAVVNETPEAPGSAITATSWATPPLQSGTTYYWHVVVHNSGHGLLAGSRTFAFQVP